MGSIVNIPFNFQPVNTVAGLNTNYTVPTGKYARVVVTADGEAFIGSIQASSNYTATYFSVTQSSKTCTLELWLKTGDVLSFTNTPASGSTTKNNTNGNVTPPQSSASTTTEIKVNTVVIARLVSRVIEASNLSGGSPSNLNINWSGTSNVAWVASEYNNVV
jgi:hypothetical protein